MEPLSQNSQEIISNIPMDTNITNLLMTIYKQQGFKALVAFVFLLAILLIIWEVVKVSLNKIVNNNYRLKSFKIKKKMDLKKHIAFKRFESLIEQEVNSIHIDCPLRSRIFKKIMTTRYETFVRLLRVEASRNWDMSRDNLKVVWDTFFAQVENEWYSKAIVVGIPKIAIDKFYVFRKDVAKIVKDTVSNLCIRSNCEVVDSVSTIFDIIASMEASSIFATGDALNSLNGELNKVSFEGLGCENCDTKSKKGRCARKAEG